MKYPFELKLILIICFSFLFISCSKDAGDGVAGLGAENEFGGCVQGDGDGSGSSAENPIIICNYEDLKELAADTDAQGRLTKHYALGADIDAQASWFEGDVGCEPYGEVDGDSVDSDEDESEDERGDENEDGSRNENDILSMRRLPCLGWIPLELHGGSFNGKNYKIRNLYIYSYTNAVGFFSRITHQTIDGKDVGSLIKNLHLSLLRVNGKTSTLNSYVGGLVGDFNSVGGKIDGCSVMGEVTGDSNVGGLVGRLSGAGATIWNSHVDIIVSGGMNMGGLVALVGDENQPAGESIYNSYSSGEIQRGLEVIPSSRGGLVGSLNGGKVKNSYSEVIFIGVEEFSGFLLGSSFGNSSLYNSYSMGFFVEGEPNLGYTGGIVGISYGDILSEDNFWDQEATELTESIGLRGLPSDSLAAIGLTTDEILSGCEGSRANDSICRLGEAFFFEEGEYPRIKKCINCSSDSPTFLDELVGN